MLYRIVEENLRVAMRCYARVSVEGESRDYPGVTVTSSGIDCAVFNSAMLTESVDEAGFKRALALAARHFEQRSLGWTFWLCEDMMIGSLRKTLRALMRANDMSVIAQPPGMYANELKPASRVAPLEMRRVDDELARLEFAHLSSAIFALPFETARTVYGGARLWQPPMNGWIGYFEGRAVSIATVVIGGGAAGVYSVGTLPGDQGRGFAGTLMRHALEETRRETGINATVLQSTSQGLNLYGRMGYRVVTGFGVYLQEGYRANR